MKRSLLLLVVAALVAAATMGKVEVALATDELLSNRGFESGSTGWAPLGVTFQIVTDPVRSGSQAASITNSTTDLYGIHQLVTSITGGATYRLSGYGYRNDANIDEVLLRIDWYSSPDGTTGHLGSNDSNSLTTDSPSWQSMSTGVITAPATAQSARVRAYANSTAFLTDVTVYFDDLSLTNNPTAVTLSSFTARPVASQGSFLPWQWLALAGALGLTSAGVASARKSPGQRKGELVRKAKVIVLVFISALGLFLLPAGYAGWSGRRVRGHVVEATSICQQPGCQVIFTLVQAYDNEAEKDVAQTETHIEDDGKRIVLNMTNAYPYYRGSVLFTVTNVGQLPVRLTSVTIDNPNPEALDVGVTDLDWGALDPGSSHSGLLACEITQQAAENAPYASRIIVQYDSVQGCTPGYWKQEQHFDSWEMTPYSTDDLYNVVFGVPYYKTLLEALETGGGGEKALGRHAVAALLNAANPNVSYYYTEDEIISMVQNAYETGDFEGIKDLFEAQNEQGCPLN